MTPVFMHRFLVNSNLIYHFQDFETILVIKQTRLFITGAGDVEVKLITGTHSHRSCLVYPNACR